MCNYMWVQKSLLEVNRLELRLKSKKEIGKGEKGSGRSEEDGRACAKTLWDEMARDIRGRKKYLVQKLKLVAIYIEPGTILLNQHVLLHMILGQGRQAGRGVV